MATARLHNGQPREVVGRVARGAGWRGLQVPAETALKAAEALVPRGEEDGRPQVGDWVQEESEMLIGSSIGGVGSRRAGKPAAASPVSGREEGGRRKVD